MAEALFKGKGSPQSFSAFSEENLRHLDETVREVFGVLLGLDVGLCTPPIAMDNKTHRRNEQTALIGFAGVISGLCEIRLSVPASIAITQAMLPGSAIAEESEWICDAIGELCNLVAGGWKNRMPQLGSACSLTIPTVIAGEQYQVHRPASVLVTRRTYSFGQNHQMLITLVYNPSEKRLLHRR